MKHIRKIAGLMLSLTAALSLTVPDPGHWVKQQYLPDELAGASYYRYGDNKTEQAARTYWEKLKSGQ